MVRYESQTKSATRPPPGWLNPLVPSQSDVITYEQVIVGCIWPVLEAEKRAQRTPRRPQPVTEESPRRSPPATTDQPEPGSGAYLFLNRLDCTSVPRAAVPPPTPPGPEGSKGKGALPGARGAFAHPQPLS